MAAITARTIIMGIITHITDIDSSILSAGVVSFAPETQPTIEDESLTIAITENVNTTIENATITEKILLIFSYFISSLHSLKVNKKVAPKSN